jgi:class 3 adenylate cyclase
MARSDERQNAQKLTPRPASGTRYRSLRAIFAADVAGFSRAMSMNETSAANSISQIRMLALQQLDAHKGWLFGMPGDGLFAIFESAIGAVRCAVELQTRHAEHPQLAHMKLRIGIHLGEVLFEDDWPYGVALAIAARLEALAEPGGILVSSTVMEAVSPRLNVTFEERGEADLKNITQRVTTFAVRPPEMHRAPATTAGDASNLDRTTRLAGDVLAEIRRQQAARSAEDTGATVHAATSETATSEATVTSDAPDGEHVKTRTDQSLVPDPMPAITTTADGTETFAAQPILPNAPPPIGSRPSSNALADLPTTPPSKISQPCTNELAAALAIHLGPVARLIVNRCLSDAFSVYDLAERLENYIPNEDERLLFRLRASHICRSTARTD